MSVFRCIPRARVETGREPYEGLRQPFEEESPPLPRFGNREGNLTKDHPSSHSKRLELAAAGGGKLYRPYSEAGRTGRGRRWPWGDITQEERDQ